MGEGTQITADGLTIQATATNEAKADIVGAAIGLAGGAGGNATSTIDRLVEAYAGAAFGAAASGDLTNITVADGILTIRLEKAEEAKPRSISIGA